MSSVAVLGASGGVGLAVVDRLIERGHSAVCQTRSAERLASHADRVTVAAFDPRDAEAYDAFIAGADAIVMALGVTRPERTTLFSEATRAVLGAMGRRGLRRLLAVTGVGAGETRGHGGFVYNRIVFPFFTRHFYADKEVQEQLIADSDTDWTIVRPGPFSTKACRGALQVVTEIPADLQLRCITRDAVAAFIVSELEAPKFLKQRPFIGHV